MYKMIVEWDASKLTEKITAKTREDINPKNGWNGFMNQLFALQIMTLPDMDNIPGLVDNWTDGISYHIEIATKNQYRFYSYHLPGKFQDEFWQAKKMVDILRLIESEFEFPCSIP